MSHPAYMNANELQAYIHDLDGAYRVCERHGPSSARAAIGAALAVARNVRARNEQAPVNRPAHGECEHYASARPGAEPADEPNAGRVSLRVEVEVHDEGALDAFLAWRWLYGLRPPDEYAGSRHDADEASQRMTLAEKVLEALVHNNDNPADSEYGIQISAASADGPCARQTDGGYR